MAFSMTGGIPLTLAPGNQLLERLPDRLFAPMASANRHRYWALLCALFQRRFGPDAPMPPSSGFHRSEIVREIESELATQDAWEEEAGVEGPETPIAVRANGVFNYLQECGWFQIDQVAFRPMVTVSPVVGQFMDLMVDFAQTGPVFVSGKVRSIHLNLKAVCEGGASGESLGEAAIQARHLLEYIRNTGTNVRDLMTELAKETTTKAYVRRFCQDYVRRMFIADYGQLRTHDHPLARRQDILVAANELQASPEQRARLVGWYEANLAKGDSARANYLFERDIQRLLDIGRIDEFLTRLDSEVSRANKRAITFIEYKVKALRPIGTLVRQALQNVARHPHAATVAPMAPGALLGPALLAKPRVVTERQAPVPLRKVVVSMDEKARQNLRAKAREARTITPAKLQAFLRTWLDGRKSIGAGEITISTVSEFRAMQVLMNVAHVGNHGPVATRLSARAIARGHRVVYIDDTEQAGAMLSSRPMEIRPREPLRATIKEPA